MLNKQCGCSSCKSVESPRLFQSCVQPGWGVEVATADRAACCYWWYTRYVYSLPVSCELDPKFLVVVWFLRDPYLVM